MQFVAKTQSRPFKTEDEYVPSEFQIITKDKVKVSETLKRNIFLEKQEFVNAIKAMEEKLGYYQYQISEHRLNTIRNDIDNLKTHIAAYKHTLSEMENVK